MDYFFQAKFPSVALASTLMALVVAVDARADDDDALALQSADAPTASSRGDGRLKLSLEAALGRLVGAQAIQSRDAKRLAVDLRYKYSVSENMFIALSNRFDYVDPQAISDIYFTNSFREAYFSWQAPQAGGSFIEVGRINLRRGPAYGFNPTDYFSLGATPLLTNADPLAIRQNRLGTGMLRAGASTSVGEISFAFAPKLGTTEIPHGGWSPRFGQTNPNARTMLALERKFSDSASAQLSGLHTRGAGTTIGASASVLVGSAAVVYLDASNSPGRPLFNSVLGQDVRNTPRANRLATGLTYSFSSGWTLTGEFDYNGNGLKKSELQSALSQYMAGYVGTAQMVQANQDSLGRSGWLVYGTKKSVIWKELDLTGFVRLNAEDRSKLSWVELRYHLPRADLSMQAQFASGALLSEYGAMPYKNLYQIILTYYL